MQSSLNPSNKRIRPITDINTRTGLDARRREHRTRVPTRANGFPVVVRISQDLQRAADGIERGLAVEEDVSSTAGDDNGVEGDGVGGRIRDVNAGVLGFGDYTDEETEVGELLGESGGFGHGLIGVD